MPLNTRFKSAEAAHVVRTSGARMVIAVTDFLDTDFVGMAQSWDDVPSMQETIALRGHPRSGVANWADYLARGEAVDSKETESRVRSVEGTSPSDIIFTSGTTGAPKGAVLTHGASVRTYETWADWVGLRSDDRYLVVYPFFHTAGLKSGVLACILTGATIVPLPPLRRGQRHGVRRRAADHRAPGTTDCLPVDPEPSRSLQFRSHIAAALRHGSRCRSGGDRSPYARAAPLRDRGDRVWLNRDDRHRQHVPPR